MTASEYEVGGRLSAYRASVGAIIASMDVRGLDLNLLIPLRVLLTERHVTRAAEKLGITQPAMSASLARLRNLFDDQLLVRGPKGLAPTARAQQLMDQLDQFVVMIEQMVALPTEFVPDTSRRTFTLIGTDYIETLLLPSLMAELAIEAPGLQIVFRPPDPKKLEALMSEAEVDLAIAYLPDAPKGLITRVAFRESFACIAPALLRSLATTRDRLGGCETPRRCRVSHQGSPSRTAGGEPNRLRPGEAQVRK